MWLLSVLALTQRVIIYRFGNAPGNGRSKIDGINGSEKNYFKKQCALIVTEESNS